MIVSLYAIKLKLSCSCVTSNACEKVETIPGTEKTIAIIVMKQWSINIEPSLVPVEIRESVLIVVIEFLEVRVFICHSNRRRNRCGTRWCY